MITHIDLSQIKEERRTGTAYKVLCLTLISSEKQISSHRGIVKCVIEKVNYHKGKYFIT
jgi:hypothetical protein